MRLHEEPDSPDIIVALAPVVGMDLLGLRVTGAVCLDFIDDQASIGE